jgi:EpsI family protein
MLAIAYGSRQLGNALQAHRPEYCYQAQGFVLLQAHEDWLDLPGLQLPLRRLLARQQQRFEPISYWMTVGDQATRPGLERKLLQLRHSLQGRIPDGMLVRVSSLDRDSTSAWQRQADFIAELHRAAPVLFGQPAAAMASP